MSKLRRTCSCFCCRTCCRIALRSRRSELELLRTPRDLLPTLLDVLQQFCPRTPNTSPFVPHAPRSTLFAAVRSYPFCSAPARAVQPSITLELHAQPSSICLGSVGGRRRVATGRIRTESFHVPFLAAVVVGGRVEDRRCSAKQVEWARRLREEFNLFEFGGERGRRGVG